MSIQSSQVKSTVVGIIKKQEYELKQPGSVKFDMKK